MAIAFLAALFASIYSLSLVKGPCELINKKEVEEAIKVMKAGMLKAAGKKGIKRLTELYATRW